MKTPRKPPEYVQGETWHGYMDSDGTVTWIPGPAPEVVIEDSAGAMIVTEVDRSSGVIAVGPSRER